MQQDSKDGLSIDTTMHGRWQSRESPVEPLPDRPTDADLTDQPVTCAIALGGNLGDVAATFEQALAALDRTPGIQVTARSHWYQNPPMGPPQPDFLNGCALLTVALPPEALLDRLQALEAAAGRVREVHWGPRTLDLDLLLYGDRLIATDRLQVPHPGLGDRAFFLVPLAEIAPTWIDPHSGRTIAQIAQTVDCSGVILLP